MTVSPPCGLITVTANAIDEIAGSTNFTSSVVNFAAKIYFQFSEGVLTRGVNKYIKN